MTAVSPTLPYFIGCPVWAYRKWEGIVFEPGTKSDGYLRAYSSAFNAVEGNNTFYGLPSAETIDKWAEQALPGFHFCFKFPKTITHVKMLGEVEEEVKYFCELLAPLRARNLVGPLMIQLSPEFDAGRLYLLEMMLADLPSGIRCAVEVRHSDFFDEEEKEEAFESLLRRHHMDRVIFDTRPLFSGEAEDEDEREARQRKPRSPVRKNALGRYPVVRLVGKNDVSKNIPWVKEWVTVVADWIGEGRVPHIFLHTADDLYAPAFAHLFHTELKRHLEIMPDLPPLGSGGGSTTLQLDLFD